MRQLHLIKLKKFAITGSCHPFLEHIGYTANFAIPMLGAWWMGTNSVVLIYAYLLGFDFLNAWGHCNFELVPYWCALNTHVLPP